MPWRSAQLFGFILHPPRPIQAPIPDGFAQMLRADVVGLVEVGDGAGEFQDAGVGPGREAEALHGGGEQRPAIEITLYPL